MKKLDFFKYAVILSAFFVVLFVAGCGDNVNPDIDGNGNPSENNKIFPTEPQTVSGGSLTKGGDGENFAVTQDNSDDFIDVFRSALDKYNYPRPRGVRALPDEYEKETFSYSVTRYGNYSGKVEITRDYSYKRIWTSTSEGETEYNNETYKYFDFSNHDSLFMGGAVGYLYTEDPNDFDGHTTKAKGRINFAGKYEGTVFFDDVAFRGTKGERVYNSDYGYWYYEYEYERVRGSFYVQSAGGQRIDLDGSLLRDFIYAYSNSIDYGDAEITITMPAVPSAPNGALSNRGGNNYSVKRENVSDFFRAFKEEFNENYNAPRAVNEAKGTWEKLEHGRVSGYCILKYNFINQGTNSGNCEYETESVEYHDYSNNGVLYFGGGYGRIDIESSNEYGEYSEETIINGRVKFNGEFKSELVFDNFRYKREYGSGSESSYNTHVSGSVKIGTLDVTEEYLEEIIKENW